MQTPAQAQFRRSVVAPGLPFRAVPPRALVATPPALVPYANSYSYLPNGLNLNQAAALNALRIQTQLYNSLYTPYYAPVRVPYYTPGITYNAYTPYPMYNPYFAAYGLYR